MTRITVTLIEIVLVVTLGVACSHSGLPAIPSAPDTTTPSNTGGKEDNTDSPAYDITPPASDATIYGRVSTVNGTPVENVVVSDGISVAVTDANGCYSINSDKSKGYIFISVPGNFTPEINGNIPQICKKLTLSKSQLEIHDFTLTPTDNTVYTLLISADQHIANRTDDLLQLQTFVLPDVNVTIAAEKNRGRNVYSLSLGDISWEQFWTANSFGLTDAVKRFSYLECLTYHSIGNHDNNPYVSDDWISSKNAKIFAGKAASENSLRSTMLEWCRQNFDGQKIDREIGIGDDSEEVSYFNRTAYLREKLNHQFVNLDQDFLDQFIDDQVYGMVFEEKE